jgi:hypothetical protein
LRTRTECLERVVEMQGERKVVEHDVRDDMRVEGTGEASTVTKVSNSTSYVNNVI